MIPLDLGHANEGWYELEAAREKGETRRLFVFADIAALESPRAVHGREPAAHAAKTPCQKSNAAKDRFPKPGGAHSEIVEHPANASPVLPLLDRDRADFRRFRRIGERKGMPFIRKSRRKLARMRSPENGSKLQ